MKIPKEILDCFKRVTGTATLEDDAGDWKRIPYTPTEKVQVKDLHNERQR